MKGFNLIFNLNNNNESCHFNHISSLKLNIVKLNIHLITILIFFKKIKFIKTIYIYILLYHLRFKIILKKYVKFLVIISFLKIKYIFSSL